MDAEKEPREMIAVIGGGIAGVSCAEHLSLFNVKEKVVVFSSSPLLKMATNVRKVAKVLEEFTIEERPAVEFESVYSNVKFVKELIEKIDSKNQMLYTNKGQKFKYKKLCICTGATPKMIAVNNPLVLGIRDTETVQEFERRIAKARRIVIVGNGGIATELAYEINNCQVIWSIKDRSIGATFFDAGAAKFFLPHLSSIEQNEPDSFIKRMRYIVDDNEIDSKDKNTIGNALGPDWALRRKMKGSSQLERDVHVEYKSEIDQLLTPEEFQNTGKADEIIKCKNYEDSAEFSGNLSVSGWPVYAQLSNGKIYGCDFVVSATGVVPNSQIAGLNVELADDRGIKVNEFMQSSDPDIYAAGDVCTTNWEKSDHWFQMRLWTQARQMGAYAAKCISSHLENNEVLKDFCFELFTHVTRFFGYKTILLGLYNEQGLGNDYGLLLRMTKGKEYIKVVMRDGRMQGAVLIGDTDFEETFENLILNQFDLTSIQDNLLNPDIDIEDYFD